MNQPADLYALADILGHDAACPSLRPEGDYDRYDCSPNHEECGVWDMGARLPGMRHADCERTAPAAPAPGRLHESLQIRCCWCSGPTERTGRMSDEQLLPDFPVDDMTLTLIEDACSRCFTFTEDGAMVQLTGAEFDLDELLCFLSGYDRSKLTPALNEYDQPIPDTFTSEQARYSEHDMVKALIAEIRRLRGLPEGSSE
jgi:hypothetical protein